MRVIAGVQFTNRMMLSETTLILTNFSHCGRIQFGQDLICQSGTQEHQGEVVAFTVTGDQQGVIYAMQESQN